MPYLEAAVRTPTGKGDVALQNMLIAMWGFDFYNVISNQLEFIQVFHSSTKNVERTSRIVGNRSKLHPVQHWLRVEDMSTKWWAWLIAYLSFYQSSQALNLTTTTFCRLLTFFKCFRSRWVRDFPLLCQRDVSRGGRYCFEGSSQNLSILLTSLDWHQLGKIVRPLDGTGWCKQKFSWLD